MKKTYKIAVIDDGVNPSLIGSEFEKIFVGEVNFLNTFKDRRVYSHGTICAAIIFKYAKNIQIVSIRITDDNNNGTITELYLALKWCERNHVDIINLSLGYSDFFWDKKLYYICEDLKNKGVVIVAAENNNGKYTIPSAFESVIGVRSSRRKNIQRMKVIRKPIDGINIIAKGNHKLKLQEQYYAENCNSFATASVCGLLCKKRNFFSLCKRILTKERQTINLWQNRQNSIGSLSRIKLVGAELNSPLLITCPSKWLMYSYEESFYIHISLNSFEIAKKRVYESVEIFRSLGYRVIILYDSQLKKQIENGIFVKNTFHKFNVLKYISHFFNADIIFYVGPSEHINFENVSIYNPIMVSSRNFVNDILLHYG